jgi:translation initiation factor 4G
LQRSESGWKPEKIDTSTEDGLKLALVKEAQGHLNKMTQVTYEKLSTRIIAIANKEQGPPPLPGLLREIINKVFEQALQQPTFCAMYAMLCAKISRSTKDFRRELLNKCQEEFESDAVEPPADLSQAEQVRFFPSSVWFFIYFWFCFART